MIPTDRSFHIPVLDGFRAMCIVLVFAAHIGIGPALFLGSLGVTIFFFISGYLITTLLRREYEQDDTISFWNFYVRRTFRIFPPFYLIFLLSILLGALGILKSEITGRGLFFQAVFLSNYFHYFVGGQGGAPHLSNLWSLAVEEHFYLFFPLLFFCLRRWGFQGKKQAGFLSIFCLAILLWKIVLVSFWGDSHRILSISELTDTRIDSILFGCILAVYGNPAMDEKIIRHRWKSALLLLSGILLLASSYFLQQSKTQNHPLLYTLQGTALLPIFDFAIRHPRNFFLRIFSWRPVTFLGDVSYTFYLVHLICLGLFRENTLLKQRYAALLALLLAVALSWLMRKYVELPLAKIRRRFYLSFNTSKKMEAMT